MAIDQSFHTISELELSKAFTLELRERYDFGVEQIVLREMAWGLGDDNSWCLLGNVDGKEIMPLWPAPEYAEACAFGQFAGFLPKAITLDDVLNKWLPSLSAFGRLAAVFPARDHRSLVVPADQLKVDLLEGCSQR